MNLAIGSTMQQFDSGYDTPCNIAYQQLNMGATVDFGLVGLTSDNDGTLRNNTGQLINLNGTFLANIASVAGANIYSISAATSPDKVNWTIAEIGTRGTVGTRSAFLLDFKVEIPDQHYVGIVAKTDIGTGTLRVVTACLMVRSEEGEVNPPLLDSKCSFITGSYGQTGVTGFGSYVNVQNIGTTEFVPSIGAIQNNLNRITNDTGQTITVDGYMILTASSGYNFFFGADNFYLSIGKNGSVQVGAGANAINVRTVGHGGRWSLALFYTMTLNPGDFVNHMLRRNSGIVNQCRTYTLQHFMRSRT